MEKYKEFDNQEIFLYKPNDSLEMELNSKKISEFLFKLKNFLPTQSLGVCIPKYYHNLNEAYVLVEPGCSIFERMKAVEQYFYNMTVDQSENRIKYMKLDLFFYDSSGQVIWELYYSNDILTNRRTIISFITHSPLNRYKNLFTSKEFKIVKNLFLSKINNNIYKDKSEFLKDKILLKQKAINFSIKNDEKYTNPYSNLLSLLNLQTDYIE